MARKKTRRCKPCRHTRRKKAAKRKTGSRGRIKSILPPPGVSATTLANALKKDKYFARVTSTGKIVTNAPL